MFMKNTKFSFLLLATIAASLLVCKTPSEPLRDNSNDPVNKPIIGTTADSINFGLVIVDSTISKAVEVTNSGKTTLEISAIEFGGVDSTDFRVDSSHAIVNIPPNQADEILVHFQPAAVGTKKAIMRFVSNTRDSTTLDVKLTGESAPMPFSRIRVAPASLDYGMVVVGSSQDSTVTVMNTGLKKSLQINSIKLVGADPNDFFIKDSTTPFILVPGSSQDIVVCFNPMAIGVKNATLSFDSDADSVELADVALTGIGIQGMIVVMPTGPVDYDSVFVRSSKDTTFVVKNMGSAELQVTSVSLTENDFSEFRIDRGSNGFDLAPGAMDSIRVSFVPFSDGMKNTILRVVSKDSTVNVALSGEAVTPVPRIAIDPGVPLPYGNVFIDSSKSMTFTVTNTGDPDTTLNVTSVSIVGSAASDFTIQSGVNMFNLALGSSQEIVVSFNPTGDGGTKNATLRIESNAANVNPLDVALTGEAVPRVARIEIDPMGIVSYGDVLIDSTKDMPFTVTNIGDPGAVLNVDSILVMGNDASNFMILNGDDSFSLPPNSSREIAVRFTASGNAGTKNIILRIESNAANVNPLDVTLTGEAVAPVPRITIDSVGTVDYGGVFVDSTKDITFTVTNTGDPGATLNATSVSTFGDDANDFMILGGVDMFDLEPNSTQEIVVRFMPSGDVGAKSATLRIVSNADNMDLLDVTLTGIAKEMAPEAPSILMAMQGTTNSFSQIDLSWTDNSNNEDGFEIEHSLIGAPDNFVSAGSVGENVTAFTDTDLLPDTTYIYRVRAFNTGGNSTFSNTASAQTDSLPAVQFTIGPVDKWYFGVVLSNRVSESATFTVTNTGGMLLSFAAPSITGDSDFKITADRDTFSLASGASRDIEVRFERPGTILGPERKRAELVIQTNSGILLEGRIALSGDAVNSAFSRPMNITPTTLIFAEMTEMTLTARRISTVARDAVTDFVRISDFENNQEEGHFQITLGGNGFILEPPLDTTELKIQFNPSDALRKEAILEIEFKGGFQELRVLLIGLDTSFPNSKAAISRRVKKK